MDSPSTNTNIETPVLVHTNDLLKKQSQQRLKVNDLIWTVLYSENLIA